MKSFGQSMKHAIVLFGTESRPMAMSPDAAARVAELGFQQVVDDLAAQAQALLPGLRSLRERR